MAQRADLVQVGNIVLGQRERLQRQWQVLVALPQMSDAISVHIEFLKVW